MKIISETILVEISHCVLVVHDKEKKIKVSHGTFLSNKWPLIIIMMKHGPYTIYYVQNAEKIQLRISSLGKGQISKALGESGSGSLTRPHHMDSAELVEFNYLPWL